MFEFFKRLLPDKNEGGFKVDQSTLPNNANIVLKKINQLSTNKYQTASCQSSGIERSHNEDTILTFSSFLDGMDTPAFFGIFLVADGMGGHQSGEVASSLAAQGASQYLIEKLFDAHIFQGESFTDSELIDLANNAVCEAQTLIQRRVPGGGTTLTLVLAVGDRLFFSHVGDSRLYFLPIDGKMLLKTKDHSLVKRLVDLGEITEQEAGNHPQRNVLYRALGQTDPFDPDSGQFTLEKGEKFLICSDGLWGVLPEKQILGIINKAKDLNEMVRNLVVAANENGGPDNISVVLVERLA